MEQSVRYVPDRDMQGEIVRSWCTQPLLLRDRLWFSRRGHLALLQVSGGDLGRPTGLGTGQIDTAVGDSRVLVFVVFMVRSIQSLEVSRTDLLYD